MLAGFVSGETSSLLADSQVSLCPDMDFALAAPLLHIKMHMNTGLRPYPMTSLNLAVMLRSSTYEFWSNIIQSIKNNENFKRPKGLYSKMLCSLKSDFITLASVA